MTARNRDLEGTLRRHLPANLFEVDRVMTSSSQDLCDVNFHRLRRSFGTQLGNKFHCTAQVRNGIDIHTRNHSRFLCILFRQYQVSYRAFAREHRDRQRAFDRPHTSVERQLADTKNMNEIELLGELAIRAENSERNRQIKTRAFLTYVSRRKIDGCLLKRKEVTAVLNGGANAFT